MYACTYARTLKAYKEEVESLRSLQKPLKRL